MDLLPNPTPLARHAALAALLALGLTTPGSLALADSAGNPFEDWSRLTLPDKAAASFTALGKEGLRIESKDSIGFLYTEVGQTKGKHLLWRWRVDQAPPASPQDRVGQDDRPLAVHIWFPLPPEERSFFERLGGVFGYPSIGRVITYVWGGTKARGTTINHPHFDEGVLIVLRGSDAKNGAWYRERIDVAADYRRAFGEEPPARVYLAISADSDDRGGMSSARLEALRWVDSLAGTNQAVPPLSVSRGQAKL